MITLHPAFCDYCSTIEGESELSRNKHRTTVHRVTILYHNHISYTFTELSNIQDIYKYSETTITSAMKLLNSNQLQTRARCRRSLLPFLGDALSWLTGTATTKDIHSIKMRINQLIAMQTSQCNTLVHIVSILNVTRYATQVNRHSINNLIDAVHTTSQVINNLYNLATSLAASINFNQMILHIRSVFASL